MLRGMNTVPILATAVLCLGLGIVIGRVSSSPDDASESRAGESRDSAADYRPARRSETSVSDASRVGKVGGIPPVSYANRIAHMKALAKKMGTNPGMPAFDVIFGVWDTAREMDAAEVRQALKDMDSSSVGMQEGIFVKAMLVMQLAKKDGSEAMAYAMNEKGGGMLQMKGVALQAWAGNDPEGAYTWYLSNKDELNPRESRGFLAGVIAGLAEKDFPAAFEKAKNVDNLSRGDVLRRMGAVVANNSEHRKQFTDYLLTLEDSGVASEAASALVGQLVLTDLQGAIQYAEAWKGENKSRLSSRVTEEWAQLEPEKALEWQLSQPDGKDSVDATFAGWARQDADSAREWLGAQADDLNKDQFRNSAAQRTMWDDDYSGAVQWASSIQDTEKRQKSFKNIYSQWARKDKEGANQWVESLDEVTREAVVPQGADQ